MRLAIVAGLAATLAAGAARADQCQWLEDPAVATRAVRELAGHPEVVAFCEPCGERAPGPPHRARAVAVERIDDRASSVVVDGAPVDLAYLYVKTSERRYRNLAALAGCPTSGVSPGLRVDVATSAGVLIRADREAPIAEPPPTAAPATVPPAAAPIVYVVSAGPPGWLILLLGWGAPLAILGGVAMWLAARRRARHEPRASRLEPPR